MLTTKFADNYIFSPLHVVFKIIRKYLREAQIVNAKIFIKTTSFRKLLIRPALEIVRVALEIS